MYPPKREYALKAAYILFMIFGSVQQAFMRTSAGMEKISQVSHFTMAGYFLGILFMSLLLPMKDLRYGRHPQTSRFPWKRFPWKTRLALTGAFLLPNIIVRLLGYQAWQESMFLSGFMAVGNGALLILILGCFFTLIIKHRVFWAVLAFCAGTIVFNLALGPGRATLLPYLFTIAGIAITLAWVMVLVFLTGMKPAETEPQTVPQSPALNPRSVFWLFPILAALIILWTNSFTNQIFIPKIYSPFAPGFNPATVATILLLPVLGFLADRWWQRHFLSVFIYFCSVLFLFTPSLLLFSNSHMLFLILYTLSIIMIQMIVAVFPFVIVDLCWQTPHYRRVYLSWLLPVSVNMIHTYAALLMGPFRSLSIDNAYAVMLLTFAAIVFFFLSRKIIPPRTQEIPAAGSPPDINDIFRKHNLSERETEVALLLAHEGLSYEEMGSRLFISERTIKFHVSNIFQKFGVKCRAEFMVNVNKQ